MPFIDPAVAVADQMKPDWETVKSFLKHEGKFKKQQAVQICQFAIDLLKKEPNLMRISEPVVVVGDVHGQYFDLFRLFEIAGWPSTN